MDFIYFNMNYALQVQDYIIEKSGGRKGLLNQGLLESILTHIQNDWYYPTLEDKVCHLLYSINKNHAFNDGNKRSSISLSAYFLQINGFDFIVGKFIREMENIVVYVADNKISKDLLHKIITEIIYNDELSDDLKFEIIEALEK